MNQDKTKWPVYRTDYCGAGVNPYWAVEGPGVHFSYGEDRQKAFQHAAAFNLAYELGKQEARRELATALRNPKDQL